MDATTHTKLLDRRREARQAREDANLSTLNSADFKAACELAGIKPSLRQASKYRRGFGRAFAFRSFTEKAAA